ncbi:MAG: tRNA pseudouridine(13) synthase TruD [Steroidobacteraceae bacterium]
MSDLPHEWIALAVDPPRAYGPVPVSAVIRTTPDDFVVDEQLGFEPNGTGPHALLRVRKRGANTDWVAKQLATLAGCRPMDIGYAGMKDRHAVTTQWFTVPLERAPAERRDAATWLDVAGEDFAVVEAHAHHRKLPRGALDANRFELTLRDCRGDRDALEARLKAISSAGVPNYFGPQRFGRGQSNLFPFLPSAEEGRRPRLGEYAMSAGRSLVFNAVLAERVNVGTWNTLVPGDLANLDARGSIFAVTDEDPTLPARVAAQDLHPTGPMAGGGAPTTTGDIQALEQRMFDAFPTVIEGLARERMAQARRALRLAVRDLTWSFETPDVLKLSFLLRSGGYATTVLREIADVTEA